MRTDYHAAIVGIGVTVFLAIAFIRSTPTTLLRESLLQVIAGTCAIVGILTGLAALANEEGVNVYTGDYWVVLEGICVLVALVAIMMNWMLEGLPGKPVIKDNSDTETRNLVIATIIATTLLLFGGFFLIINAASQPYSYAPQ